MELLHLLLIDKVSLYYIHVWIVFYRIAGRALRDISISKILVRIGAIFSRSIRRTYFQFLDLASGHNIKKKETLVSNSPGRYNLAIQSMIEFRSKMIQFNF